MASSSSSSSSFPNSRYDLFVSFRGDDVRQNFFGHLLKELDRKLITTFKDMEIEKGESLDPVLKQAIKDSRIGVVLFSKNYASSAWCLNELVEIVKCQKEFGQRVVPIFYRVDPSHVRKQSSHFGKVFQKTCYGKPAKVINQWKETLTSVANLVGSHIKDGDDEANWIELIANYLLDKLISTPSMGFEKIVGIQGHIAELSSMLDLESPEVRVVGIWGPSGIGKTTIARVLFNRILRYFQGYIYIDRHSMSKSRVDYNKVNLTDYNTRLHLQENFLSELLDKEGIKIYHLGAVREKLKHQKVLIFIDDLEDKVVLDVLAGRDEWFGPGSRILAITKDKSILNARGIKFIYEVGIPSEKVALQIFCQSAFMEEDSPSDRFMELASEISLRAGGLPLGLNLLGSSLRGRDIEFWETTLTTVTDVDGTIEKALKLSYDALETKDLKEIFRHIACFFNGDEINNIKLMLADSGLKIDIGIGLKILTEKSLIHEIKSQNKSIVEMHCLVEKMGQAIVCAQSDEPGEREFLIHAEDVCHLLENKTGTNKVVGISLDLNDINDECKLDENAFEGMKNLRFLRFNRNSWEPEKEVLWKFPGIFDNFPPKLKLLSWPGYPMKHMPSKFRPEKLVELKMPNSKILEDLWEGDKSLKCLKDMDLSESQNLKKMPDLSKATNLETLNLHGCSNLVELPSSILNLNKLKDLNLGGCTKLEDLPTGNLESLNRLNLAGCSQLKTFPNMSNKISELILNNTAFEKFPSTLHLENLVELRMEKIMSRKLWEGVQNLTMLKTLVVGSENLIELPDLSRATRLETLNLNGCSSLVELTLSSIQNLNKLTTLEMIGCSSLETLPTDVNLKSLYRLNLNECSKLKVFPDISSNISYLFLNQTAIKEVPSQIKKLSSLQALEMWGCKKLKLISAETFKLKKIEEVFFSDCKLAEVRWPEEAEDTNNTCITSVISFIDCSLMNQETIINRLAPDYMILSGAPCFTHRSTTDNFLTIPLPHSSFSQQSFLKFKASVVVSEGLKTFENKLCFVDIEVHFRFIDKHGNYFASAKGREISVHQKYNHQIIFDCRFPLNLEYDQVEIRFHLPNKGLKVKGCGVLLLSDDSAPFSAIQNEADVSIADNDGGYEQFGDESEDEGYETAIDEEECGDNVDGEI